MAYDSQFISGETIDLPKLSSRLQETVWNGGQPVEHSRHSIVFSTQRHFAILTAHHIDGSQMLPEGNMPKRRFRFDPELPNHLQVDNDRGYRNNPWDRGHLVRRRSLQWGDHDAAVTAAAESDYWTNIAPQHTGLHHGAWGKIENWMLEQADQGKQQACVFTGPVNTPDDPLHVNQSGEDPVQIPAGFWKIIVLKHEGLLKAAGFLVWQRDYDSERPVGFEPMLEQVRLTTIEYLTGLTFPQLRAADPLLFRSIASGHGGITRGVAGVDQTTLRPAAIQGPEDLVL